MRLLRDRAPSAERAGLCDAGGRIRGSNGHVSDIGGEVLSTAAPRQLADIDPMTLPKLIQGIRIGPKALTHDEAPGRNHLRT